MAINELHERYQNVVWVQSVGRRYPSHHMLQRLEDTITDRETAEAYFHALMDEQETRRYPSHHMLERARRIMVRAVLADEMARLRDQEEPSD